MPVLTISRFAARVHPPTREPLTWQQLVALFSEPRRTPCTTATCLGSGCPHKDGACWSPAVFRGDSKRSVQAVEAISCLALDVDHVPEAALTALRDHLARYAHVIHATHADRPNDRCLRAVVQLSRSVVLTEWPRFGRVAVAAFRIPADPPVSDAGRCYFLPSRPRDADYFVVTGEGEALDVDALLEYMPVKSSTAQEGATP